MKSTLISVTDDPSGSDNLVSTNVPTIITHAIAGTALGQFSDRSWTSSWKFWALVALCSALPDVDTLGLYFGIPYGSFWGHRGFLHSLLFAAIAGTVLSLLVPCSRADRWKPALLISLVMASHGVLDAMTDGGLGIAFFSPFDLQRYFFAWRPIRVSPIGSHFFSNRGVAVIKTEALVVWIPAFLLVFAVRGLRMFRRDNPLT